MIVTFMLSNLGFILVARAMTHVSYDIMVTLVIAEIQSSGKLYKILLHLKP